MADEICENCNGQGYRFCPECGGAAGNPKGPYCGDCRNTGYWPCDKCDAHENEWGVSGADALKKLKGDDGGGTT